MLTALCQELRNWFERDKHFGDFTISEGSLDVDFLQDGQYFRIVGSVFNDGVHKFNVDTLNDEEFNGAVWEMAIPEDVVNLANEISAFVEESGQASPYTAESWGGYSYTKATDTNGAPITWQSAFLSRLNKWRKI